MNISLCHKVDECSNEYLKLWGTKFHLDHPCNNPFDLLVDKTTLEAYIERLAMVKKYSEKLRDLISSRVETLSNVYVVVSKVRLRLYFQGRCI